MLYDAGAVPRSLGIRVVRHDGKELSILRAAIGRFILGGIVGSRGDKVGCEAALLPRVHRRAVGLYRHTAAVRLVVVVAVDMASALSRDVRDENVKADGRGVVLDRLTHDLVLHPAAELGSRRARERRVDYAVSRMDRGCSVRHSVPPFRVLAYKKHRQSSALVKMYSVIELAKLEVVTPTDTRRR